jgi:hypothetical protein
MAGGPGADPPCGGRFYLRFSRSSFARMTNDAPSQSLLEELDSRQSEVLDELERLNGRIEQVIAECGSWRGPLDKPLLAVA